LSGAIGAFNIFNYESIRGVAEAAITLEKQVYLQTSASVAKYYSPQKLYDLILLATNDIDRELFKIHLDHCSDLELIGQCIDIGWDSVMIDASHLPLDENIRLTKNIVQKAHGQNVVVEGELGQITGEEDGIEIHEINKVKIDDVLKYISTTKVDLLAVGIGNKHGYYTEVNGVLDFNLLEKVHNLIPDQPLVLHGGTGIPDNDILHAIDLGIRKINISTELKECYLKSLEGHVESEKCYNMNDLSSRLISSIKQLVYNKIKLFSGMSNDINS